MKRLGYVVLWVYVKLFGSPDSPDPVSPYALNGHDKTLDDKAIADRDGDDRNAARKGI